LWPGYDPTVALRASSSIDFAAVSAFITALALLIGAVFAVRKFTGEKTSAIVTQQSTLLADMRELYETQERVQARMKSDATLNEAELVACKVVIVKLKERVAELEHEIDDQLHRNHLPGGTDG